MLKCVLATTLAIAWGGVAAAQQPAPLMLFFDWGKPDIRTDDLAVLDQAVAAWRASPGSRLTLAGYTDRSGSAAHNLRASLERAKMVCRELESRGVPSSAISMAAYGEERPLVPTEDGVREVQNRRVEIRVGS